MQDKNFQYGLTFGSRSNEKWQDVCAEFIAADLAEAQAHLHELPESQRRGLTLDTLRHFGCGYLSKWVHSQLRAKFVCGEVNEKTGKPIWLPPPSERIIIPTSSRNHFNAVATPRERVKIRNEQIDLAINRGKSEASGEQRAKELYKQHAGTMELFCDPAALKADNIVLVEGEIDCMSIFQATQGKVPVTAILGCNNGNATLGKRLCGDLKGKRFVILFDADAPGKKAAKKFHEKLIKERVPAVIKYLYDYLPREDRKVPQAVHVDANELLQYYGGEVALERILDKTLATVNADLDKVVAQIEKEKIEAGTEDAGANLKVISTAPKRDINLDAQDESTADKSARQAGFYSDDERRIIADITKNYVHARNLTRDDWFMVGCVMKRYGFELADFDRWSDDGDDRYSAERCRKDWNTMKTAAELGNKGFKIGTLINFAKDNCGYKTPAQNSASDSAAVPNSAASASQADVTRDIEQHEKIDDLPPELQEPLKIWQAVNGEIFPPVVDELKDAFATLTAETFNPADVDDPRCQKQLALLAVYATPLYRKILKSLYSNSTKPPMTQGELKKILGRHETTIRRDQNKFTQDAEQKRRERENAAAVARYKAKMPTTQKEISDCPADLLIPENVYFGTSGAGLMFFQAGRCYTQPAALSPCVPVKVLRDPRTNSKSYEVAVLSRGKWHSVQMTATDIADSKKILRLADYGAQIEEPAKLCKFFARMLAANEISIPEINCYSQPGWHGAKFIYPPSGEDYIVHRGDFDYPVMFAKRGDADMWKKIFLEAVDVGGAVARAFVGNALAAPLVRLLNLRNLQLHVHGKGGTGKSTLNALAASIFGNPRRLIRTFAATRKNMLSAAAAFDDLPSFYDELETVKRYKAGESIADMVYEFSEGIGNQANRRDGTARQPLFFAGSRNSTAERPILQSNDLRGALRRLWQIRTEKIFTPEFSAEISAVIAKNYGLVGDEWFEFVSSHPKEIIAKYNQLADICKTTAAKENFEPQLFQTAMTAAFAFQMFLVVVGVNHIDEVVNKAGVELDDNLFALIPTARDIDDSRRALDDLRSYTAAHIQLFIRAGQSSDGEHYTTRGEYLGKICNDGDIAFFTTALKKILESELGFASCDALVAEWYQQGLLKTSTGGGYRYYFKVGAIVKTMYRFKGEVFQSVNDIADKPHQ